MTWTQPICNRCWNDRHPDNLSASANEGEQETCAFCGTETISGIYVRENPAVVPYPAKAS